MKILEFKYYDIKICKKALFVAYIQFANCSLKSKSFGQTI